MQDDLKTHQIPLTQGLSAQVSAEDFERISAFKWHAIKCANRWYARRSERQGPRMVATYMHRQILGGDLIDHINGDGLDNRRENLRVATASQNNLNIRTGARSATGLRCVYLQGGKYIVRVGKEYGGCFDNAPEAAFYANALLDRLQPGIGFRNPVDFDALRATLLARRDVIDAALLQLPGGVA